MKVLIVHNRYRSDSPSGENEMVVAERDLLVEAGVTVRLAQESSDTVGESVTDKLRVAGRSVRSTAGRRRIADEIHAFHPDVVHFHNVFPLWSPAAVQEAGRLGVATVQTLHNYRHLCVKGTNFRDGMVCTECQDLDVQLPAVRHGCYRGSRLQSVPMVLSNSVNRAVWQDLDTVIALTPFMADRIKASWLTGPDVVVRPSWRPEPPVRDLGRKYFLYVGRLSEEKGVRLLVRALRLREQRDIEFRIAGDGPLRHEVESAAAQDGSIRYLGPLDGAQVAQELATARALFVPSLWFEGFPLTLVEAFAAGRPVVTVFGNSVASVVSKRTGWVIDPTPSALQALLDGWDERLAVQRGGNARVEYERCYSPQAALTSLTEIYSSAVARRRARIAPDSEISQ